MTWRSRAGRCAALALGLVVLTGCGTSSSGGTSEASTSPGSAASFAPTAVPAPTTRSSTAPPTSTPIPSAQPSPSPSRAKPSPKARPGRSHVDRPVIVIDPGHSGRSIRSRTVHGLLDFDYPNQPEMTEVFDVSACVASGLRADGYTVIPTKKHAGDSVNLTERARIANRAKAALAISVHDDHSQGPSFQATYSQLGVKHNGRYPIMYRGTGSRRTVFDNQKVAKASDRAARLIAKARTEAQGYRVTVRENSFTGRPPLEPGNLALVQLLSRVPWVYNEMGAKTGGSVNRRLSLAAETGYAKGLLDGVEAAVPIAGATHHTSTAQLRSCLASRR